MMPVSMHNTQVLLEKIQSLPTERICEVEDFVDFLQYRSLTKKTNRSKPFEFPVISVGSWPDDLSLSREDMYNDDGR